MGERGVSDRYTRLRHCMLEQEMTSHLRCLYGMRPKHAGLKIEQSTGVDLSYLLEKLRGAFSPRLHPKEHLRDEDEHEK